MHTDKSSILFFLCLILFFIAVCAVLLYLMERRRSRKLLEQLLQELDSAIDGDFQDTAYDETLDAAIRERLNRLVQITRMQKEEAFGERDSVKSLISDLSHQIRTPLSNILLYSGLLEETLAEAAMEPPLATPTEAAMEPPSGTLAEAAMEPTRELEMAAKIRRQAEKLEFFIKELTRSSYLEQEMIAICPRKVLLEELIDTACQSMELNAMKKDIRILRQQPGDPDAACYADPKWTVEALANILENAIKYSPEHSSVQISVLPFEAFLCVEIKDSGMGIPEEEQGAIFRRFYRSPQAADTPGFGIGLYLVREILTRQGGYVKVSSAPGKGSSFQVFLSKLSPLRKI